MAHTAVLMFLITLPPLASTGVSGGRENLLEVIILFMLNQRGETKKTI